MLKAKDWIDALQLKKHPEGGYFKETYRSEDHIGPCCLGRDGNDYRSISTAIFYLLKEDDVSMFHRLRSDELWHYYAGASLSLHILGQDGQYAVETLGINVDRGEIPQVVVPAGLWFGATVNDTMSYCIAGCSMAPGFDFKDFEIGSRDDLIHRYPDHRHIIQRLTR